MKRSQNSEQNPDERWNIVKNSINKSAEIFKKKAHPTVITNNSWFNYRCKEAIEKRIKARIKLIQDPSPNNIEEFIKKTKKKQKKSIKEKKKKAKIKSFI